MTTIAQARGELQAKTRVSQKIAEDRSEILNSGLAANLEMPHPIFIQRGEGPYVFDADGNQYIDTSVGYKFALWLAVLQFKRESVLFREASGDKRKLFSRWRNP